MAGRSLISVIAKSVCTVVGVNVVGRTVRVNGIVGDSRIRAARASECNGLLCGV